LRKEINKTMKVGYGIFNAIENKLKIERIERIQEIYKVKLIEILRGIWLCDNNTKINIFTDSKSVYKTINKARESTSNENLKSQMILRGHIIQEITKIIQNKTRTTEKSIGLKDTMDAKEMKWQTN
jgi:hypothetical protein